MSFPLRLLDWTVTAIFAALLYAAAMVFGPQIEARYWPVVSPFEIIRVERAGPSNARIWLRFTKHRDCAPLGVFIYKGRRGGPFDAVNYVVEKRPSNAPFVNRPLGEQTAGPWLLDATENDVSQLLFADAQHACNPFWTTVTHFYR